MQQQTSLRNEQSSEHIAPDAQREAARHCAVMQGLSAVLSIKKTIITAENIFWAQVYQNLTMLDQQESHLHWRNLCDNELLPRCYYYDYYINVENRWLKCGKESLSITDNCLCFMVGMMKESEMG